MNRKYGNKLTSFQNVLGLVTKYATELGDFVTSTSVLGLKDVVEALMDEGRAQVGAKRQAKSQTVSKDDLRANLRAQMAPFTAAGQARLADLPLPKMAKFNMPDASVNDVTLIASARALHALALEYPVVFSKEKLAADAPADLSAATDSFQEAILSRDSQRLEGRRATLGISELVRQGLKHLTVIERVFARVFARKPQVVGEIRSAVRVPRSGKKKVGDNPVDPGTGLQPA